MSDTIAKITREQAVTLLRQFDARLDEQPQYAARARATPLPDLLRSLRGFVDDSTLDAYLEAVDAHGLMWLDVHVDVHTVAAEVIVGGMRR